MSKARTLANLISDNADLADGQISVAEVVGAAPLASPTFTGTTTGTFSGSLTGDVDLSAIAKDITDTAVDVFVYDTSKDSDGGAWRKRTQGTSWYNETLNTSTRGATKKFPAVAVIVVEAAQVTIYDGDDPSMPMWMVFNGLNAGSSYTWHGSGYSGENNTSASMKNGVLCIGVKGSVGSVSGLSTVSFIDEVFIKYGGAPGYIQRAIELRNAAFVVNYVVTIYDIAGDDINDVAMTVLPNAPIDANTGLPVPTIAVATAGGVSVIKDDGSVVDLTSTSGASYNVAYNISFTEDGKRLRFVMDSSSRRYYRTHNIPTADTTHSQWGGTGHGIHLNVAGNYGGLSWVPSDTACRHDTKNAIGSNAGVTVFKENTDDYANSMVAYVTSDYNTGWMNGDTKLATLSDTDTTNNPELITNGTFATNLTGWTEIEIGSGTASFSVSSGKAVINLGGSFDSGLSQSFTTVVGKTYSVSYDLAFTTNFNYSNRLDWGVGTSLNSTNIAAQITTSAGTPSLTFIATGTTAYINIRSGSGANTTGVYTLDNISVRIAESDRSVNAKGLQTFGTVTKTAVATGAELVGYSGFSTSNYLQQPNNSDFEFGTDDWSMMGWITQVTNDNSTQHPIQLGLNSGSSSEISILRQTSSSPTILGFRVRGDTNVYAAYPVGGTINANVWTHFVLTKSGSQLQWYINGELIHSTTSSTVGNIGFSASDVLRIGHGASTVTSDVMKLALLRISATAPTAEQIAKIYNDEKHLFTTNAKADLYGTSDAVTALAYDDDTNLLHVGTSAGRSVFQGLNRVDNTTDAVGTAISASNGFIVEE